MSTVLEIQRDSFEFEFEGNLALSEEHKKIVFWQAEFAQSCYSPASRQEENIGQEFYKLAVQWREETRYLSSISEISMNPEYQKIIGMGGEVVPFILRELKQSPAYWFWALKAITRVDPVPVQHKGNIEKMTECWLKWGLGQGYVF
ncbi:MAG: hypothetical protein HY587_07985 [Candidatus Omnitrophica bacterium]|nr:hypothetical protein [Candidatus Omnitrophota bacterium]